MARRLNVEGLSVNLGGRQILREITFSADGPEWFGLLGVNGSGKTTLLRTLAGRLSPSNGRIVLDEVDVTASPQARSRDIGFSPPLNTLPGTVTAGELLALVAAARGADPQHPGPLRDALEIERLQHWRIKAMSSGMRQRLALFLAFLGEPRVVLLDEPFNWLDPVGAFDAKDCLAELARRTLIVTALHDVATFALRCSSGLLLQDGAIARRFKAADLQNSRSDMHGFERGIYDDLRSGRARGGSLRHDHARSM